MARRWSALIRTMAVAVVVTVVPVILVRVGNDTVPRPSTALLREWIHQPLTPGFLAALVLTAAWLVWALLATAVAVRVYTWTTRLAGWLPPIHLPRPLQGLTAAILGASAITTSGLAAQAASAPATATLHEPAPHGASTTVDTTTRPVDRSGVDRNPTHTVRRGESLSTIAQHRLGDRDRWDDIFTLNRGTRFPVGGALTDPDVIHPGWILDLPVNTATPPNRQQPRPDPPEPPAVAQPAPESPTPAPTTTAPNTGPAAPTTPHASDIGQEAPGLATAPTATCETASPAPAGDTQGRWPARGVSLPGGSWVDAGLAAAIAAAVTLVWAHRQHRYVPRTTPSSAIRLDDSDLTPMPHVVRQIRHGLRRAVPSDTTVHDARDPRDGNVGDQDGAHATDDIGVVDRAGGSPSVMAIDGEEASDTAGTVPVAPALAHRPSAVWPSTGLGLTGPGAHAAARGLLTAALAADRTEHPDARTHVVMRSTTAAALLGTAVTLPRTPRLTVTTSLDEALQVLETQTMHRSRLVDQHEIDTVAALRRSGPWDEPLPRILFIADEAASHERTRIAAILAQGERLDIHGVLLAAWPDGDTVVVDTDGTTTPTDGKPRHGTQAAHGGRLAVLTPAETIDVITVLAEAHPDEHQALAAESTGPVSAWNPPPALAETDDVDELAQLGQDEPTEPVPTDAETVPDQSVAEVPAHAASHSSTHSHPAAPGEEPGSGDREDPSPQPGGRIAVRVLGDARIVDMDTTVPLRAKSLELLVYLAVHDGDASQDAILDDLLPDAPRSKAPHRLHTYVSALRKTLARTGGTGSYLTHPARRYALNREALDVDLWRMRDALRDAERATSDADRLAALRAAVNAYGGGLAEGFDYEWIEAHREGIRRQALDAHLALATATTDPTEALTVLEAAIRHDPYGEPLYQQAMRARAALGHLDEIRALRRTLTRRLDEIDTEPSEDTTALADRLIAGLRQRRPAEQPDHHGGRP
ncbi:BTAD domain-containing putative transcriptional regulator [Micromonospora inyonensis]|uniref:Transcriptional activator domain-containing protein n=1 Tax=Micromonospora inyonensis TaxID=47866 RepID=A0A1C6RKW7_9ACTN|nr:BTAD domain-containing putative transcriptional regulator [Micromonospora inyonensis]SCL17713.1 transcriptional activator domain-containing protein [Micromonospora inyonensis]